MQVNDAAADFLGRACGLLAKGLDLARDDGKTLAGFARAGGLDCSVERQKVGFGGNCFDGGDNLAARAPSCKVRRDCSHEPAA